MALLPAMVAIYLAMTVYMLAIHIEEVPGVFARIVSDAFNPQAVGGGFLGVMLVGISRGAFSNEAGVGTEVMAHGAAKTNEPIREGLVAMLGPVADTLVVCTCTALVILLAGDWQSPGSLSGISLTVDGKYYFRQGTQKEEEIEDLSVLVTRLDERDEPRPVIIRCDARVEYRQFAEIKNALRQARVETIFEEVEVRDDSTKP